jgi:Polyketide cyclase / dehydrase and lipid transport
MPPFGNRDLFISIKSSKFNPHQNQQNMNIIVTILLCIAGLIALLLIIGLFSKKAYAVERSITINKPRQQVFEYIKYLKNQDNFSKWASMDPDMKKEFRGTDGTPGFISAWEGNKKVGKGEQEIKQITEGRKVDFELRFIKPFPAVSDAYMTTDDAGSNQTTVKWGFSSSMKYPMNIMLLFLSMDKMIGRDFDTGLSNLKGILEK